MAFRPSWIYLMLAPLLACACGRAAAAEAPVVKIGSKAFTESVILGEILTQLSASAGADATHKSNLGDTGKAWNALQLGDLDAYCEYIGTLTQELLTRERVRSQADLALALEKRGLRMGQSLGFSNSYGVGMKESVAKQLNIKKISDLRKHPEVRWGLSNPFLKRADGWEGLLSRYALRFATPDGMEHALAYKALDSGTVDVIDVYTTDAEIRRYHLVVLEDDRGFFPDYSAVILYRADLEDRAPKVVEAFRRLEGRISAATMQQLNAQVGIDKENVAIVARDFLAGSLGVESQARTRGLLQRLAYRTGQHLMLVVVSLLFGIATAIPLGILAAREPIFGQTILAVVGAVQTIPALALLSVLIILMRQTGPGPAIVALYFYSLLPMVRNTWTGLHDIPLQVRESAEALGLSPWARLRLIELPMASRAILAGIKTAAVINVGFATLGGLIAAGGYGDAIVAGLQRDDYGLLLEGALPAMAMALAAQGLFEIAERFLVPRGLRLKPAE
jgi:osmoprotectant transport system permease protein